MKTNRVTSIVAAGAVAGALTLLPSAAGAKAMERPLPSAEEGTAGSTSV